MAGGAVAALPQLRPAAAASPRGEDFEGTPFPPPAVNGPKPPSKPMPAGASKRPRRFVPPPGLLADGQAARTAYNSVDPVVGRDLEAHLERLTMHHEGVGPSGATGAYVLLERCHSCREDHALTTRHEEEEYDNRAKGLLAHVMRLGKGILLGSAEVLCRLEAMPRCLYSSWELGQDVWHHASRVGAFEVYLLTPQLASDEDEAADVAAIRLPPGTFVAGGRQETLDEPSVPSMAPLQVPGQASRTWGAKLRLQCGYTATLLHSKLSSNAWPGKGQLSRRLFAALPPGCVSVRVVCPSGELLPSFGVEVLRPAVARGAAERVDAGDVDSDAEGPQLVATGQGVRGVCNVRGVPPGTALGIRVLHPTVSGKVCWVVTSRLSSWIALGADVAYRLWTVEVPGGLRVYASDEGAHPSKIPEDAKPMVGEVEMTSGEKLQVKGRVRLPWWDCSADREGVTSMPIDDAGHGASFLGVECSTASSLELPSGRQLRHRLPQEVISPAEALMRARCEVLLKTLKAAVIRLEHRGELAAAAGTSPAPPVPFQVSAADLEVFTRILELGCQFMASYRNAALEHWRRVDNNVLAGGAAGEDVVAPLFQAQEAIAAEPGCSELASLCAEAAQEASGVRLELERACRGSPHLSRGARLAGAYLAAAAVRPSLLRLAACVAEVARTQLVVSNLKGADGGTRALERAMLGAEAGPPKDLARCRLICSSAEHMRTAIEATLAALGAPGSTAVLAGCSLGPQRVPGSAAASSSGARGCAFVELLVLWGAGEPDSGGGAPLVGELQIVHEACHNAVEGLARSPLQETRFLVEARAAAIRSQEAEGETIEAFSMLRRMWVRGYKPAGLDLQAQTCTMELLYKHQCLEIGKLAAPEVHLRVVMAGELLPLEGVRVQVEEDRQLAKTDASGGCMLPLRPGEKVLRLRHPAFASGWADQRVLISGIAPRFQVPMPVTLFVWRAPVIIRGKVCAWEVWLATSAAAAAPSTPATRPGTRGQDDQGPTEPFSGVVLARRAGRLQVTNGQLELEAGPVTPLPPEMEDEDQSSAGPPTEEFDQELKAYPLSCFALEPPFARRKLDLVPGQEWEPYLLGTHSEGLLVEDASSATSSDVVLRARTRCCGCGVSGVRISEAPSASSTEQCGDCGVSDNDGVCVLLGRPSCPPSAVRVQHPALGRAGEEEFAVSPAEGGALPSELPLFFEPCVHLFTVEEEEACGGKLLQAFAGGPEPLPIPLGARPFLGRLLAEDGREYDCAFPPTHVEGEGDVVLGHGGQAEDEGRGSFTRPLVLPSARLRVGNPCPVSLILQAVPIEDGFEWRPLERPSDPSAPCGLQLLLRGAVTMGTLRPVATLVHVDGSRHTVPVEECPTAADAARHLAKLLGLDEDGQLLPLAAPGADGALQVLAPSDAVVPGSTLQVLCRYRVRITFGRSTVGLPGVRLAARASSTGSSTEAPAVEQVTGRSGECELLIPVGVHTVTASHAFFTGGAVSREVDVQGVSAQLAVASPAGMYAYIVDPPEESAALSMAVWLCTSLRQVPAEAKPVAGTITWGPRSSLVLEGSAFRRVSLTKGSSGAIVGADQASQDEEAVPELPVESLAMACELEDLLWDPSGMQMFAERTGWQALLDGPVCAGYLRAPIEVRVHGIPSAEQGGRLLTRTERLFAETHTRARDVAASVSKLAAAPPSEIGAFLAERRLADEDAILPRTVVDVWPLAPLNVRVCTPCCRTGVPGVAARLSEDHLMSGLPRGNLVTDPLYTGSTGPDGCCQLVANVGPHQVHLTHPLLANCPESGKDGRLILGAQLRRTGAPLELPVSSASVVFAYTTAGEKAVSGAGSGGASIEVRVVWLCARVQDVPQDAAPALGTLLVPGAGGLQRASMQRSGAASKVLLPLGSWESEGCPLAGLAVEAEEGEALAWRPSPDLGGGGCQCPLAALASFPLAIGTLRPAVIVLCDSGRRRLRYAADECGTVAALRQRLSEELRRDEADIAVYTASQQGRISGRAIDSATALVAGQKLAVGFVAELCISVCVMEGAVEGGAPLAGVCVEVDGEQLGVTDTDGRVEMLAAVGHREVLLRHPCFGASGRKLQDVEVIDRDRTERTVVADVRLYFYATDPEVEEAAEEEEGDADAEDAETAPSVEPTLVWVCGSPEQIPHGAVHFEGRAWGVGAHGHQVSVALSADRLAEMVLMSAKVGATPETAGRCDVATVGLEAKRPGFKWRPKDPSPLAERAGELGESEYMRLLACPVVLGFLEPSFRVLHADDPPRELTISSYGTAGEVQAWLAEELGVDPDRLWLLRSGTRLSDSAHMEAFTEVVALEVASVTLCAVTSCCGEAVDRAEVFMDGEPLGTTDADGLLCWDAPVGSHRLWAVHPALGRQPKEPLELLVSGDGQDQQIRLKLDPRLYIYTTEPEAEEEEEGEPSPKSEEEEEEESMPLYDPSCVWVAADPEQIPEDAGNLRGCVRCPCVADGHQMRVKLDPTSVLPFFLPLGRSQDKPTVCPLGGLRLQCSRPGYRWAAKDPPPLAARAEELGGCELLRLLACPAALGFLKPAVTVQCASGKRLLLPLDSYGEVQALRAHLAEELDEEDSSGATLQLFALGEEAPLAVTYLKGPTTVLAARAKESIVAAKEAHAKHTRLEAQQADRLDHGQLAPGGAEDDEGAPCLVEDLPLDREGALPPRQEAG